MTHLRDKVVALTGAASGIGRALAIEMANRGAHLAISDVNDKGLRETAELLKGCAGKVTTHVLDVRSRDAVFGDAADVEKQHGGADAIINTAGLTVRGSIDEVSYEDFALVIDVNLWGVVHGVKAFLPLLRKRAEGHIVNISSINAMVPFAKNGPYNISKYAVLGLSETLVMELRGSPIHVTCVHPGGIRTNIVRNAKGMSQDQVAMFDRIARTSPAEAAQTIVAGIERNKNQVFIGIDAKAMAAAKRIAPGWIVRNAGAIMQRFDTA